MKQLLLLIFTLCTISASAQKLALVSDENGDKRVSIGDVTYTIDAIQKDNDSFSLNDVDAVVKRVLGKRNVLTLWMTSGVLNNYYLRYDPFVRYEDDDIVITTSSDEEIASEIRFKSDEVIRISYEYLQRTYEYVDLGLPSGTLWATCNVGANSPEGMGDFFAWGETVPKSYFDWSTYKYCNGASNNLTKYCIDSQYGTKDGKMELDLEDDAAYINCGHGWCMPSYDQQQELCNTDYCTWTWTSRNGTNGYLITSKRNGNSIFLPSNNSLGFYWSRSLYEHDTTGALELGFNSGYFDTFYSDRYQGRPVRPVRQSNPNWHEYVDLGLPSGTLWATRNIGANSPEEYGHKFAWGELEPKSTYDWSTYKYCQGSENTMTKYCVDSSYGIYDGKQELDLEDDIAYTSWGADWRMPSYEQQSELLNTSYCTWTWTNRNGTDGYLVKSRSNGNSIFLPADNSYGVYWSRSLFWNDSSDAIEIGFNSSNLGLYHDYRFSDCAIRPVRNK